MNVNQNTVHRMIMEEYKKDLQLRTETVNKLKTDINNKIPRLKQIDEEISMLAVKCAKLVISEKITPEQAVEKMNIKKQTLVKEKESLLEANNIVSLDSVPYKCDKCHDTGYIDGNECVCYRRKLRQLMLDNAKKVSGLSYNIDNDTFSKFKLDYYSKAVDTKYGFSPYDNIKSIYAECIRFTENFKNCETKNLFFYGGSGLGKTFLSNCITNRLLSYGVSVVYQTAYKLFQFLEDYKFGKLNREANEYVYNSIYGSDLLIIDDLGTEFITSYTCSVFFDVLNTRLMSGKKIILSTNLGIGEIEKIYSQRVFSRILGDFSILGFFGDDIRRLKNNQED